MDVNMQGQATPDVPRRRPRRLQDWLSRFGMFNLNDPRWGRGDDNNSAGNGEGGDRPDQRQPRGQGPNQGPPDLDELWRDFNRKLGGLLGGNKGRGGFGNGGNGGNGGQGGGGSFSPNPKAAGIGAGLVAGVAIVAGLGAVAFWGMNSARLDDQAAAVPAPAPAVAPAQPVVLPAPEPASRSSWIRCLNGR